MLLTKLSAGGEPGLSETSTCSRTPGANLEAQPAFCEYFVILMRVRSSMVQVYPPGTLIDPKYGRDPVRTRQQPRQRSQLLRRSCHTRRERVTRGPVRLLGLL